jgi:hypothetical protein
MPAAFELVATRRTSTGVIISTFARAGKPTYGSFMLE